MKLFSKRKVKIKTVLTYIAAMIFGLFVALISELKAETASTIIIKHDLGGSIKQRIIDINQLSDKKVIIDGVCASSCTMLLKIACVTNKSKLYFHGPSSQFFGVGLPKKEFDKWSNVMANYYPNRIKEKFLTEWRYTTVGTIMITGKDAIKLYGVNKCQTNFF